MTVTASHARAHLVPLIEQVNNDRAPVEIVSREEAVLISLAAYESLGETTYLLRSPANAVRLLKSISDHRNGCVEQHELAE